MPFDLTTARPTAPPKAGFDLTTARAPKPSAERRAQGEAKIKALETERADLARRSAEEQSLTGRVTGTLKDIGRDVVDANFGLDYLKDYGKGIATSLEETEDLIDPGELLLGVGAPAVTYPLAMAAGSLAAPFSGDYGGVRDAAFENLNSVLPEGAKDAQRVAGSALKPVGDLLHTAGEGIGEIAGLAGLPEQGQQNVADISEDLLGLAGVKSKAPKGTPVLNAGPPKRAPVTPGPTADPLARARDAGYKIAPSARTAEGKSAAPIGGVAEGVSGRTQMQHRVDQFNDQRVIEGIRKDLGLQPKVAITKPVIDAIMNETGLAYKAVSDALPVLRKTEKLDEAIAAIGARRKANPLLEEAPRVAKLRRRGADAGDLKTEDVMAAVQEFRDTARTIREGAARTEKPEMQMQMAAAYREMADLLEAGLDDALKQEGRADLIPALKNARMKRAKAYQAFEAVSGKKRPGVALMDMKLAGETLSGEMDLAADVMRDMSPNGPLHVNMAKGAGNAPGDVTGLLQGVVRPLIQPVLTSEFGQARMFGPRVPESLVPYAPEQFEVPPANPTIKGQGDAFGGPLEFEPPGGNAGGPMPSDVRRLNSTIAGQTEALGPLLDLERPIGDVGGPRLGPEDPLAGVRPGPNQGPPLTPTEMLDLELAPQFLERRRQDLPYTGIDRRVNGVPDLSAERQRVLDRPIGEVAGGIADEILADPDMQARVRGDTRRNRQEINPEEGKLDIGDLVDSEQAQLAPDVLAGDVLPAGRRRADEPFVDDTPTLEDLDAAAAADASIAQTVERLRKWGWSDEEIADFINRRR